MPSIDTDLSGNPTFDDFAEEKNFHQILFRPAVPIQARELNQLQTILQNQVERFGNHIFKDGTILTGCNFSFDPSYTYVKLADLQIDGQPIDIASYGNTFVRSSSNLTAIVVNGTDGFESQNPNLGSLYIKYQNSGTGDEKAFANSDVLTVYARHANGDINTSNTIAQVRVANSSFTAPTGSGYALSVAEGYIYQKGYFIRVDAQTVIVSAYDNVPDGISVGFTTAEEIIDENTDTSLLDNASGFSNENAPGALRLKLTPTLVAVNTASTPNNFFALVEFESGRPVKQRETTEYNQLGREMAKRTVEESGNYVVNPFSVTSSPISGNTTHLSIDVGSGLAYIDGYRIRQYDKRSVPIAKGTTSKLKENQSVTTNYGNYVLVNELLGSFAFNFGETVNLRDTAGARISGGTYTISSPGNVIGTARVRSVVYESGTPGTPEAQYRLYLFDVNMNAGKSFSNVLSVQSTTGIGDVVQEGGSSYLYETDYNSLIFPFGQKALKTLRDLGGNTDTTFSYRTEKTDSQFSTSGLLSITLPAGFQFPYTAGSTLNDTQERDIIVVPLASANSANLTGTASITNGSNVVTGSGTTFVADYAVGGYISVLGASAPKRITAVSNNTSLQVESNFSTTNASSAHAKAYVNNVPIKLASVGGATMNVDATGQILTISLGNNITPAMNAVVVYNATKTEAIQLNKTMTKNAYVKVDANTNAGLTTGPWSLGLPDVLELVAVYKHTSYTGIEDSSKDVTSHFTLDKGQTENGYGLAKLRKKPASALSITAADKLLVKVNVFQSDATGGGKGYYSVDSYPIDDATLPTPNTKIRTEEIPVFVAPSGSAYDLRNCIDFRPYCANTANVSTTAGGATENPSATETYAASEKYFPVPNESMTTDLQYYLGRKDTIVLDSFGGIQIVAGLPSENPVLPGRVNGTMTLAHVTIPPYPSLSIPEATAEGRPDYAVKFVLKQNRRYTMEDIGQLDKRINNLEYYTSLSLLEKQTKDLVIPSSLDATLDRFKNGILVDPFNDLTIANLQSPEFKAGIDASASELVPKFNQAKFDLEVAASSNVTITGDGATLDYTDVVQWNQPYASRVRNLTEQFYSYRGRMTLIPSYDNFYETRTSPQNVVIDTTQPTLELIENLNQVLGLNGSQTTTTTNVSENLIANTAFDETYEVITTTTTTTVGQGLAGTPTINQVPVGDFVTDVRFMPYIREQRIHVYAYGLRPLTRVYPFFDKVDVSAYSIPASVDSGDDIEPTNYNETGVAGDEIRSNSIGEVFFILDLPADTFLAGERELTIIDIDDLDSQSSATTMASSKFNAYNFAVDTAVLSTRSLEIDSSSVISSSVVTDRTTVVRPIPQPPGPVVEGPGGGGGGGIGGGFVTMPSDWRDRFRFLDDPLAQTFRVDPAMCAGLDGMYLTKIDVYFKTKSSTLGATLELRTVQNGYPTKEIIPFSTVHKKSADISTSNTAATATTFTFPAPVFLRAGLEYAFVLKPDGNSPDYLIWAAEIGGEDVLTPTQSITQDWGEGMLFMSHNNSTWTPIQNEDLKFKIYRADFSEDNGSLTLQNKDYEFLTLESGVSGGFAAGERVVALGSNATGNVVLQTGNTTVGGVGTSFLSTVSPGGWLTFVSGSQIDVKRVKSVTNNTSLVLYAKPAFSNAAAKYQHNPTGSVFFYDADNGLLVLEDSTAANGTFLFDDADSLYAPVTNSSANVASVDDRIISHFQPLIYRTVPQGTNISMFGTTTANNGSQTTDQSFVFGATNYLNTSEAVIMSRSNEIVELSGDKSFVLELNLASPYSIASPFVDLQSCSILYYENLINNDLTNEHLSSGNAASKYISKTVNLAENQESEDMRVIVTAYRPLGTDVSIYARLLNEFDNESFVDKNWTKLEVVTNLYSDSANRQDFVELEYTFPDYPETTSLTGVVATTNASANVVGVGTDFSNDLEVGQSVSIDNGGSPFVSSVASITNATHVVLDSAVPFTNPSTTIAVLDEDNSAFRDYQNEGVISYINGTGAQFGGYKTFAIKVVMTAEGTHKVPRLKDLRAIALTI